MSIANTILGYSVIGIMVLVGIFILLTILTTNTGKGCGNCKGRGEVIWVDRKRSSVYLPPFTSGIRYYCTVCGKRIKNFSYGKDVIMYKK